jgi:hypothetical protein
VPSAWSLAARSSLRGLGLAAAFGVPIVAGARITGMTLAFQLGLVVALTLVAFALHSAWRMARGLQAFAETVPADPDVDAHSQGARLRWPAFGLVVQGRAGVMREPDLEARAGGEPMSAPVDEGEQLAEEALESLGIDPR